jgi:hypothetical protein
MLKRLALLLLIGLLLPGVVYAQDAPQAVLDALAALNQKLGTNLILANLTSWNWEQKNFPDTSLGCPQPGQTYTQVVTSGFIVQLSYNGTTYDYRVAADRSRVFLCSPGGGAPAPSVTTTPAPTLPPVPTTAAQPPVVVNPVTSPGTALCPGGMVARLAVGMQGQAITTGSVNIRSTPGTTGQVAGLLLPGGTFTVSGGPSCQGSQTWWQIRHVAKSNETITGWVMEGDAPTNDYWLQPLGGVAPPPAAQTGGITAANVNQLRVVRQTPLAEPIAVAAQMPNGNALMVAGSQKLQFFAGGQGQPLLTVGQITTPPSASGDVANFALVAAVDSRFAAVETPNSLSETMTLWTWAVAPGAAAPAVSGQVGIQVPRTNSIAITPDGKKLALGIGFTTVVRPTVANGVWILDTATNQVLAWPLPSPVVAVAISPDGLMLAAATNDNNVHLYSLASNAEIGLLSASPISLSPGKTLVFSANGGLLAVAADDGAVRVWDIASRTLRYTLVSPAGSYPRNLAFNPAGTLLAVCGPTQTLPSFVSLWDLTTGAQVAALPSINDSMQSITFDTTGGFLNIVGAQTWYTWGVP